MRYDIVIIGGGIAGLSAALTAARLGRKTLTLTGDTLGGQLVSIEKIEGYPGFPEGVPGYDLGPMTQEMAEAAGAEFTMGRATGLARESDGWRVTTDEGEIEARGVVVATGSSLKKLGVPGEDRLFGKGVSHCASCDAPLLRGKTAIVAGGGDSALQEALTLAAHAAKVVILQRGDSLTGQASYRERVGALANIEIRLNCEIVEILGDSGVTGARARDIATGETSDLATDAVFAFIGLAPVTDWLAGALALDADGRIPTDPATRAMVPGLCAAGNVRSLSPHRAASAAGDGAAAAIALDDYLSRGVWRDA